MKGATLKVKIYLNILGTLFILLMSSCSYSPRIGYSTAGLFEKGVSYTDLMKKLDREPLEEKELMLNGTNEKYKFLIYKRYIIQGQQFASDKYDLFVFAFKNEKLYFWGNLDEFKTSDDLLNNSLGKLVSEYWEKR